MKKIILVLLIIATVFSAMPIKVEASCHDKILGCVDWQSDRGKGKPNGKYQDTAYYLQIVLDVIKYAGVIACIAFTVADFFKEIISDDKDGHKKVVNKAIKRLIFAVIIFVLPIIVMEILKMVDIVGTTEMYGIN